MQVFFWIFLAEMLLKLGGLGITLYLKDKFNIFEAIIVLVLLIDMII